VTFHFLILKTHFRIGRLENKEKRHFYHEKRTLLPTLIYLLDTENSKNLSNSLNLHPLVYLGRPKEQTQVLYVRTLEYACVQYLSA
jgi:hypothetical protein